MRRSKKKVRCVACDKEHTAYLYDRNGKRIMRDNHDPDGCKYASKTAVYTHLGGNGWFCKKCKEELKHDDLYSDMYKRITNYELKK